MKDESRQPTSVEELQKLAERCDQPYGLDNEDDWDRIRAWLNWTSNFLSARKLYHKKARIRTAMLEKMAKTLLSKDELDAIDNEAEKQLGNLSDEQPIRAIVGVCKEDDPDDVDEAYGKGTYARLFPNKEDE